MMDVAIDHEVRSRRERFSVTSTQGDATLAHIVDIAAFNAVIGSFAQHDGVVGHIPDGASGDSIG